MKNKAGREFALLLVGLGMLGCGLVMFFTRIHVYAHDTAMWGLFGGGMGMGGFGILFVPLILSIVLWVFFPKSIWPRILLGVTIVAMIIYVISLIRISFKATLLETIMYILLIFIGGALSLKILVIDDPKRGKDNKEI